MEKMEQYPGPRRAVPMNFVLPSRTSRILSTPGIVLATVLILFAASLMGIIIGGSMFDAARPRQPGESAAQVVVLIAVSFIEWAK